MQKLKIRYRQVIVRKPAYGRFPEYQVVDGRKIVGRFDLLHQALKKHPDAKADKSCTTP